MTFRNFASAGFFALAVSAWLLTLPAVGHAADTASTATQSAAEPKGLEEHITNLHTQLGITTAEEPAWNTFAQVMRTNATRASAAAETAHSARDTQSAPDMMKSYADLALQRGQDLEATSTAFATLYASFPDAQKKAADTYFRDNGMRHSGVAGGKSHH